MMKAITRLLVACTLCVAMAAPIQAYAYQPTESLPVAQPRYSTIASTYLRTNTQGVGATLVASRPVHLEIYVTVFDDTDGTIYYFGPKISNGETLTAQYKLAFKKGHDYTIECEFTAGDESTTRTITKSA